MSWDGIYTGVVVSTKDPQNGGRVRLLVPQVAGPATSGWAPPAQIGGVRPRVGAQVWVLYQGGDASYPVYLPPLDAVPGSDLVLVQDWTEPALAVGFTQDGNSNGIVAYRVISVLGSLKVEWKGGVGVTYDELGSIAGGGIFLSDLVTYTPTTLRTAGASCSAGDSNIRSVKVDFWETGEARIVGTNAGVNEPSWVSLNDVSYFL